jgi:hypothetical protein
MKRISSLVLLAVAGIVIFSASSCNKIKEAVANNINDIGWTQSSVTITIPATNDLNQHTAFGTAQFDINQYIKDNGGGSLGNAWSYVKHIYLTALSADLQNADANNNFSNFDFSAGNAPALIFNSTASTSNAVLLGGTWSQPAPPYTHVDIPVNNSNDIKAAANGTDWAYGLTYKLSKPLAHDLQVTVTAQYNISFKE